MTGFAPAERNPLTGRTQVRAALGPADPALREAYSRYLSLVKRAGPRREAQETDDELLVRPRACAGPRAAEPALVGRPPISPVRSCR